MRMENGVARGNKHDGVVAIHATHPTDKPHMKARLNNKYFISYSVFSHKLYLQKNVRQQVITCSASFMAHFLAVRCMKSGSYAQPLYVSVFVQSCLCIQFLLTKDFS